MAKCFAAAEDFVFVRLAAVKDAIAERLREVVNPTQDERIAMDDALRALRVLFPGS